MACRMFGAKPLSEPMMTRFKGLNELTFRNCDQRHHYLPHDDLATHNGVCHGSLPLLAEIKMPCCLFGTKPHMDQCYHIDNCTFTNKSRCNSFQVIMISIHEITFEYAMCRKLTILFRTQCDILRVPLYGWFVGHRDWWTRIHDGNGLPCQPVDQVTTVRK